MQADGMEGGYATRIAGFPFAPSQRSTLTLGSQDLVRMLRVPRESLAHVLHFVLVRQLRQRQRAEFVRKLLSDLPRTTEQSHAEQCKTEPEALVTRQEQAIRSDQRNGGQQPPPDHQVRESPEPSCNRRQHETPNTRAAEAARHSLRHAQCLPAS